MFLVLDFVIPEIDGQPLLAFPKLAVLPPIMVGHDCLRNQPVICLRDLFVIRTNIQPIAKVRIATESTENLERFLKGLCGRIVVVYARGLIDYLHKSISG